MTALALFVLLLAVQEPPVFGVRVDTVQVDAYASQGGQPLRDLRAEDFEVKDEGVVQRVELVAWSEAPVQAILALDVSASVAGPRLESLKTAARAFLDGLRPVDRPLLATFSHEVRLAGSDGPAVRAALDAAQAGGATALHDAVYAALQLADSRQGRPIVVVFTDGADSLSWLPARSVVEAARESDAVVYAVGTQEARTDATTNPVEQGREGATRDSRRGGGYGQPPAPRDRSAIRDMGLTTRDRRVASHPAFLRDLAAETGGRVWSADRDVSLTDAFLKVLDEVKTRYVLRYEPTGGKKEGFHRLEVRLRGKKGDVRARRGYVYRKTGA